LQQQLADDPSVFNPGTQGALGLGVLGIDLLG
jgi:hypothetical protein